jgi:hypothetical protein
MGILNFWKKKAEEKTLEQLVYENEVLKKEFEDQRNSYQQQIDQAKRKLQETEDKLREEVANQRVMIHYYPGSELFVIIEGELLHSEDVSPERYEELKKLREEKDVLEIRRLLQGSEQRQEIKQLEKKLEQADELTQEEEKVLEVVSFAQKLVDTGDFEVRGDTVQLKGVNRSIPKNLLDRFTQLINSIHQDAKKEYEALKNYWRWMVTNPNAQATEDFYPLIERFNVRTSKEGFILAYRWVKSVKDARNAKTVSFISNQWADIKKRKKGPTNFEVYYNPTTKKHLLIGTGIRAMGNWKVPEGVDLKDCQHIGNLNHLYLNITQLQGEQTFTDGWTGTMKIRIGEEVSIDRKLCDESGASCSSGLHAAFNIDDYSSNGDTKLLVAICPRDIVSVPYNGSKFRCCRYLPIAVLKSRDTDDDYLSGGEGLNLLEHYFEFKVNELKELAEKNTVQELTLQRLLPERIIQGSSEEVAHQQIDQIVDSLQQQITLDDRIQNIE